MTAKEKQNDTWTEPMSQAWWKGNEENKWWLTDVPILAPYELTTPGEELITAAAIGEKDLIVLLNGVNYAKICMWDIWYDWRNPSKPNPAASDREKQLINEMQKSLGRVDDGARYLRIQIACVRRCFWTFPRNIDVIIEGITRGEPNIDEAISCEPPWSEILRLLRYRAGHPACSGVSDFFLSRFLSYTNGYDRRTPRQGLCRMYLMILTWWTAFGDLDCLKAELPDAAHLAEATYRYLGVPTKKKCLYVHRLCFTLMGMGFPRIDHPVRSGVHDDIVKVLDANIRNELIEEKDDIGALIRHMETLNGPCHHAFARHMEHILAAIGAGKRVCLSGAGEERKFTFAVVANYVNALGSWLAARSPKDGILNWPDSESVLMGVYETLGSSDPKKRWLVACLWKQLQENMTHPGRGLLDTYPEKFALSSAVFRV